MTTENQLSAAIRDFIEAANCGTVTRSSPRSPRTPTSTTGGREFCGYASVRAWNRAGSIGVRSHFEFVSAEPGATPGSYIVILTVTGDGFNGSRPMNFELRDGRIVSLRISCGYDASKRIQFSGITDTLGVTE